MPTTRSRSTAFRLPPDYTFTPNGSLIHVDSFSRIEKLLDQANKRDPDSFGLYIYNDYFGYAILDLVDKTLSTIHTHITKKRWLDAWHALDALARFSSGIDDWINVDDGDRVFATEAARGAMTVRTIRALDAEGKLNEKDIPDIAYTLQVMIDFGDTWADTLDTCYHLVLKGYAKKLFDSRTDEEWELIATGHSKAFEEFEKTLNPEVRESRRRQVSDPDENDDIENDGEDGEQKGKKKNAWYADGKIEDIDMKDPSFRITTTWKEYKSYLDPDEPFWERDGWDLTTWTEADKKPYKLGTRRGH